MESTKYDIEDIISEWEIYLHNTDSSHLYDYDLKNANSLRSFCRFAYENYSEEVTENILEGYQFVAEESGAKLHQLSKHKLEEMHSEISEVIECLKSLNTDLDTISPIITEQEVIEDIIFQKEV